MKEKSNLSPLNKGFIELTNIFYKNGWIMVENIKAGVVFINPNEIRDVFKIRAINNAIEVVFPIPNSNISYNTKFKNYFEASEYVIEKFNNYLDATL
jgi:hypothetical protein